MGPRSKVSIYLVFSLCGGKKITTPGRTGLAEPFLSAQRTPRARGTHVGSIPAARNRRLLRTPCSPTAWDRRPLRLSLYRGRAERQTVSVADQIVGPRTGQCIVALGAVTHPRCFRVRYTRSRWLHRWPTEQWNRCCGGILALVVGDVLYFGEGGPEWLAFVCGCDGALLRRGW